MFFIGGGGGRGGRGGVSADNTPAQRKTPLNPPKPPPFLDLAPGGGLSMISNFRESPPPCCCPFGRGDVGGHTTVQRVSFTMTPPLPSPLYWWCWIQKQPRFF